MARIRLNQRDAERQQWGMDIAIASDIALGISQEERLQRALAGDESAFAWIVETFSGDMAQVCLVVVGDLDVADEAVAAAWPIAWRTLGRLRDPERLRSWLISIAANQARQMARARRRRMVREIAVPPTVHPAQSRDRDSEIDLKNALATLSPDDRALLALRYVAGFDSNELARATGLSPSGTRARRPAFSTRCEGNLAMTESIAFEDRIAEQLRAYAAPAARPPRREAVANAVEAARNARGDARRGLRWPTFGRPSVAFAAAAGAVVIAVVGIGILRNVPNQPAVGEPTGTQSPTPTATPTATGQPSISGSMWPQSTLDEVRAAQERADAGDPDYTWQVDLQLFTDDTWTSDPGQIEIVDRFLREVLGWEAYVLNPSEGMDRDGYYDTNYDQRYLRCEPGRTNPLYPGEPCAPTLDDLRYESVSLDLAQLVRQASDGIWVVSRWSRTAPFAQADPELDQAAAEATLEAFAQARVDGSGAEGYATAFHSTDPQAQVPLLYATTTGARYERFEIERVNGPGWPHADMQYAIRMFAEGGDTVVEQPIYVDDDGDLSHSVTDTTENGEPIPTTYEFFDGQVSVTAALPWGADDLDHWSALKHYEHDEEQIYLIDDPWPATGGCLSGARAADAEALALAVASDPDLVTTAPVAVTIAGRAALSMQVTMAPRARCQGDPATPVLTYKINSIPRLLWIDGGSRIRLYLLDAPEGSSRGILAIAIKAPESRFDSVAEEAIPILESVEFRVP